MVPDVLRPLLSLNVFAVKKVADEFNKFGVMAVLSGPKTPVISTVFDSFSPT